MITKHSQNIKLIYILADGLLLISKKRLQKMDRSLHFRNRIFQIILTLIGGMGMRFWPEQQ